MELHERIARALLIRTYCEVSAVVFLKGEGAVLGAVMFHTRFADKHIHSEDTAAEIWLMTNHPEGSCALYREDMRNIAFLRSRFPYLPLRVFVTGEDIGCREVFLSACTDV